MTSDDAEAAGAWAPGAPERLGRLFTTAGRLGFWVQFVPLILTLALAIYAFRAGGGSVTDKLSFGVGNIVSLLSLSAPIFTTFWMRGYVGLGARIADEAARPSRASVLGRLWLGIWVGVAGCAASLILLFGATSNLLYVLLTTPQVGVLVAPQAAGPYALSVTAVDAVSLMSLVITLIAELTVIALSLWLVFRMLDAEGRGE